MDIEEISRFKRLDPIKDKSFLDKIFTKRELAYCFGKANSAAHLAGRFVAKEAVFKALTAAGSGRGISLKRIEILANIDKVPQVRVRGLAEDDLDINLSISHCSSRATAFALVLSYEKSKRKSRSK